MNLRARPLACAGAVFLVLVAGPVSGAPVTQTKKSVNPFAGKWSGTWTGLTPGGQQEGEVTLTVDEEGNMKGESFNQTVRQTAIINGTFEKDGRHTIEINFPNATYTASGTVSKTSKGTVIGTLTQKAGDRVMGSIQFEIRPVKSK